MKSRQKKGFEKKRKNDHIGVGFHKWVIRTEARRERSRM